MSATGRVRCIHHDDNLGERLVILKDLVGHHLVQKTLVHKFEVARVEMDQQKITTKHGDMGVSVEGCATGTWRSDHATIDEMIRDETVEEMCESVDGRTQQTKEAWQRTSGLVERIRSRLTSLDTSSLIHLSKRSSPAWGCGKYQRSSINEE